MIIRKITSFFRAGTSTAIMGPSGSGKTTLLNFLASISQSSNIHFNGELKINGHDVENINLIKHRFSYVYQDDILYEQLTIHQHILATARLAGLKNPLERTNQIIDYLGLNKAKDVVIGDSLNRGISGGERKRTSIANEIITDPSVLYLDEPTTGLDSKSALDIGELLRNMA